MKKKVFKLKYFLLSVLSGVLLALSFQKINAFYLAWAAFIPLLLCIKKNRIAESVIYGFVSGLVCNAVALYWILPFLNFNLNSIFQSCFVSCLLWVYLALYFSLWALGFCIVKRYTNNHILTTLWGAVFWLVLEYVRMYLFSGFGWNLLGYTQASFTVIIQISDILGPCFVSAVIMFFNISLFFFIKYKDKKALIAGLAVFFAVLTYGIARVSYFDEKAGTPVNVGIVQPNIDQYKKWDKNYFYENMSAVERIAEKLDDSNIDLAVYPETVIPGYFETDSGLWNFVQKFSSHSKLSIIGAPHYDMDGKVYNSVFAIDNNNKLAGRHDKNHLVVFGEYIPFRKFLSGYFSVFNNIGDFSKRDFMMVFKYGNICAGSTICSENFFPGLSAKAVNNGAKLLVNHTNDAWFLDSAAPYQHFVMNIFRAVENKKYVAVSANTGISAIISPSGKVTGKTKLNTESVITGTVYQNDVKTVYDYLFDKFLYAAVIFLAVVLVVIFIK